MCQKDRTQQRSGCQLRAQSRTGPHVVARIIEIVSETPFDEFLRERIFNPLEMNSSYFNLPSDKIRLPRGMTNALFSGVSSNTQPNRRQLRPGADMNWN